MPYILKTRAEEIVNNPEKATQPGDWNFLYSNHFARILKTKGISYDTFHYLSSLVERPELDQELYATHLGLINHVKKTDLLIARTEAMAEVRRRFVGQYEDLKRKQEDRIDPYSEMIQEA